MNEYFEGVGRIEFEGVGSDNPLSFKHYDPQAVVAGKKMAEHLRFACCYWHSMKGGGADPFGQPTRQMPWEVGGEPIAVAKQTMDAMFEFVTKLGVSFWCFHDRDISPEMPTLRETNAVLDEIVAHAKQWQDNTGVRLLWGTACLFAHPRYMAGAATSPDARVFAHAGAQVKKALEATHELGGQGYVFWGGREGYDCLLNTDLKHELTQLARFLRMAVDYAREIGFGGAFYIEPKPKEPTKHQYDYDAQSCHAFLLQHGLAADFKLNIEANHATLAGHSFHHDVEYAGVHGLLGSIDANRGDTLLGWDTDQFPTDLYDTTRVMLSLLTHGGFTTGGLNFDAKVRRQSVEPVDLFYAHIGGMDAFARGLKAAANIIEDGRIEAIRQERYADWDSELGRAIRSGEMGLRDLEAQALEADVQQAPSGRQELIENLLNEYL